MSIEDARAIGRRTKSGERDARRPSCRPRVLRLALAARFLSRSVRGGPRRATDRGRFLVPLVRSSVAQQARRRESAGPSFDRLGERALRSPQLRQQTVDFRLGIPDAPVACGVEDKRHDAEVVQGPLRRLARDVPCNGDLRKGDKSEEFGHATRCANRLRHLAHLPFRGAGWRPRVKSPCGS